MSTSNIFAIVYLKTDMEEIVMNDGIHVVTIGTWDASARFSPNKPTPSCTRSVDGLCHILISTLNKETREHGFEHNYEYLHSLTHLPSNQGVCWAIEVVNDSNIHNQKVLSVKRIHDINYTDFDCGPDNTIMVYNDPRDSVSSSKKGASPVIGNNTF